MKLGLRETIAVVLVVLVVLVSGLREPRFLQPKSIESILLWMPLISVVAMGEMIVIVTRGIDISVGSILGCSGISVGLILGSHPHLPLAIAVGAGIAFGALLGFINAALIAWGKLSPLIVTIATLAAYRGLTIRISGGREIDSSLVPDSFTSLANTGLHIGSLTFSFLLLFALAIAGTMSIFLRWSKLGRNIFAYGGNPDAAYLRGISPTKIDLFVYTTAGALAGLAGVMYMARFGFLSPVSAGDGFELTVIAAVVIGGVKLNGGSGSVFGVLMGCLLLSCINVALSVLGIDANWQLLCYGVVILAAILIDSAVQKSAVRRSQRT